MRDSGDELRDRELVRAVQAGDGEVIGRVLALCAPAVHHVVTARYGISGADADDIIQETRVAFWGSATGFRGECSLRKYVVQIARRKCIDYFRNRRRSSEESLDPSRMEAIASRSNPEERAVDRLTVRDALRLLTPRQRMLLLLFYRDGCSYREIAGTMGIAMGTVAAWKLEIIQRLRSLLRDPGDSGATGDGRRSPRQSHEQTGGDASPGDRE